MNLKLNGYLTVFLSLSLTLLLSVFFVLIREAFINYSKMKLECVADIGMNSVLGEFHRELLEQYDLLFIDLSYGTGEGDVDKFKRHLSTYINQNLTTEINSISVWNNLALQDLSITGILMPHHYEGRILKRQACAYISDNLRADSLNDLSSMLSGAKSLDEKDEMVSWRSTMNTITSLLSSFTKEKRQEVLSKNPEADVSNIRVIIDNPAREAFNNADEQINNLVGLNKGGIINLNDYYSHRRNLYNESAPTEKYDSSIINEIASDILFRSYLFEKMGYYNHEKERSLLNYQIEYLIFGDNSDEKNLKKTKNRVFGWRFADNVRLYFSDSRKRNEASAMAATITALIVQPQLKVAVANSLLFAWAFSESVDDVKTIFDGGKVPLVKKSIGDTSNGLSYYQYLELMLMFVNEGNLLARSMDIIEMDIRQTPYNHNFRIDWCIESFRVSIIFHDRYQVYSLDRRYGY